MAHHERRGRQGRHDMDERYAGRGRHAHERRVPEGAHYDEWYEEGIPDGYPGGYPGGLQQGYGGYYGGYDSGYYGGREREYGSGWSNGPRSRGPYHGNEDYPGHPHYSGDRHHDRSSRPGAYGQFRQGGQSGRHDWDDDHGYEHDNSGRYYGRQHQGRSGGHDDQFDPDYSQWRDEQMRGLDEDYRTWRNERYKKFSDEFSQWRSQRGSRENADDTGSSSGNQGSSSSPDKRNK